MNINLNVKIKAGLRTRAEVLVTYGTTRKVIQFANGVEVSDQAIANWIIQNLTQALREKQEQV